MSKRALWLAFGALSVGFVVVSCTSSDGATSFDGSGGEGAGGDPSSGATSSSAGSSNAEAGASQGEGGNGTSSGDAGAPGGGVPGGGATFGGAPGDGGTSPTGDAGAGGAGVVRTPCETVADCGKGQICAKETCEQQKQGRCLDVEASTPVCGCDGVTYLDDSLASGAGVDVRGRGICSDQTAVTCEGTCAKGQTCGMVELRGGDCNAKIGGVCWQLPETCPEEKLATYSVCESVQKCLTLCQAVQSGVHAIGGGLNCGIIALP